MFKKHKYMIKRYKYFTFCKNESYTDAFHIFKHDYTICSNWIFIHIGDGSKITLLPSIKLDFRRDGVLIFFEWLNILIRNE